MSTTTDARQDDDEPTVLEDAFIDYRDAGLRLPPVPRDLVDELDEYADWLWGTEETDLESIESFTQRARDPASEPIVAFGNVGHGVSSWWLCYQLIIPDLAVFVRQPFGGAYANQVEQTKAANAVAAQLEQLIVAAEAAKVAGRVPEGQRLIVMLDEKSGSGWEVAGDAAGWRETATPIEDALAFCGD